MGFIRFDDGTGVRQLSNGQPTALGRRFTGWTPSVSIARDVATPIGTRRPSVWEFAATQRVTFSIENIPQAPVAGNDLIETALRLSAWLARGGAVDVGTEDDANRTYTPCWLPADVAPPDLEQTDGGALLYRMAFTFEQVGGVLFTCRYGGLTI